jgi:hypothetical protein
MKLASRSISFPTGRRVSSVAGAFVSHLETDGVEQDLYVNFVPKE